MPKTPLLTIITINYNDKIGLQRTFDSVFHQTFQDFEYIVIDGGSSDGSKELIENHADKIDWWISEKDNGVYNAMNKGIAKATGQYINFMNGGDVYFNLNTLQSILPHFSQNFDIIYGDVEIITEKNYIKKSPETIDFEYLFSHTLPHQSTFILKNLFEENHYYREDLKIVADWEFFIYCIAIKNASTKYVNSTISKYDLEGLSSNNHEQLLSERDIVLKEQFGVFYENYKTYLEIKKQKNIIKLVDKEKYIILVRSKVQFRSKLQSILGRLISSLQ